MTLAADHTFHSLDAFAEHVAPTMAAGFSADHPDDEAFTGVAGDQGGCKSLALCRDGWAELLEATLEVAQDAVTTVEAEDQVTTFHTVYDVAGCDVDVGRYLSGEPECMVSYPLITEAKQARVITLCASVAYSASVRAEHMVQRGQVLTALALALSRLGISTELWADITTTGRGSCAGGKGGAARVRVKAPDDLLDPARILFAYAHPAMLRRLGFAFMSKHGAMDGLGRPSAPRRVLPEGTIYLPEILSGAGAPNAARDLRALLAQCGITSKGE